MATSNRLYSSPSPGLSPGYVSHFVLDLGGQVLVTKAYKPLTLSPRKPITIRNGAIHLAREQRLLVGGQAVCLEGVTVVGPAAAAPKYTTDWANPKGLFQVTGTGSSLHVDGCTLWGGAHDAVLVADGGGRLEMSGACVVSGHPKKFGCIVSRARSSLEAVGCTMKDNRRTGKW